MLTDGKTLKWIWPDFTPWELRADRGNALKDNYECLVERAFLDAIQMLRSTFGKPLIVSSYYRSPEYNAKVSSTGESGPHTTAKAIDFQIAGEDAYMMTQIAMRHGFTGIGVNQRGPWDKRFIHVDILGGEKRPRLWNY